LTIRFVALITGPRVCTLPRLEVSVFRNARVNLILRREEGSCHTECREIRRFDDRERMVMRRISSCILLVAVVLTVTVQATAAPAPDKTVVLTFDDAVKSHLTAVAPILKEYGFGATFFITHRWMDDTDHFMTWKDVAEVHRMGFEIGNHSWTHRGFNSPATASRLEGELALVENELAKVDVPKPVSFAWPGNSFGPEALDVLKRAGYRYARRGMQPEVLYGQIRLGPMFDPAKHHPLVIPSAGDAYPDWDLDHFKTVVDRARNGKIAVVQFHGVPDVAHPWVHTPVERFREYMSYLNKGGFKVIPLRDVGAYLPEEGAHDDPMVRTHYPWLPAEVTQTRQNLDFWLENMIVHHGYTVVEAAEVCGLPVQEVEARAAKLRLSRVALSPRGKDGKLKVLPYPGGRHPRIGFLDGAINPQRGTKVSIFPPWGKGDYVVLDLPEAIFSNLGLTFLAHTHIPTIWDEVNTVIENVDWTLDEEGTLRMVRTLPNGIKFAAVVEPRVDHVSLELSLENGTQHALTDLRTQICLMLKGAQGFNEQTEERRLFESPVAAVKHSERDQWILVAFERCGRVWGNSRVPCIHSDPVLPDVPAGKRVSVMGRLWFYEGTDVEKEIRRARERLSR
jgi:peptidoglycan/xylan/chitin deacetylase (PgdA/CDA1 family)